jgi:hypothetical protein
MASTRTRSGKSSRKKAPKQRPNRTSRTAKKRGKAPATPVSLFDQLLETQEAIERLVDGPPAEPEPDIELEPRARFLAKLAAGYSIAAACRAERIGRRTAYDWRERDEDFAKAWDAAIEEGSDILEDEARRRAHDGVTKPVYQGGALVGVVREYSDTLLIFLLKARRPQKFRDNVKVDVSGKLTLEQLVTESLHKPEEPKPAEPEKPKEG